MVSHPYRKIIFACAIEKYKAVDQCTVSTECSEQAAEDRCNIILYMALDVVSTNPTASHPKRGTLTGLSVSSW